MIGRGRPTRLVRGIATACLLLTGVPAEVGADEGRDMVRPGARVRLIVRPTALHFEYRSIQGLLVGIDADTVTVSERPGEPGRAIPMGSLQRFEVSRGQKSSAGRGAVIGLLSGAAGGVAAGVIVCSGGDCVGSGLGDYSGLVSGVLGVGGGLFGLGMGALIGGRFHEDRWERVPLPDLRMGIEPSGEGVRFRLSLAFP